MRAERLGAHKSPRLVLTLQIQRLHVNFHTVHLALDVLGSLSYFSFDDMTEEL